MSKASKRTAAPDLASVTKPWEPIGSVLRRMKAARLSVNYVPGPLGNMVRCDLYQMDTGKVLGMGYGAMTPAPGRDPEKSWVIARITALRFAVDNWDAATQG